MADLAAGAGWIAALAAMLTVGWQRLAVLRRAALVAEAAHELRGPLCAAGLALHGAGGDARRVAAAERELRRAERALEDLSWAPLGRRAPERVEPVDAVDVAAEIVAAWAPAARGYGAALHLDPAGGPAPVRADRLRLAQAVANLVANAAEHGTGDVVVRVHADRERVRIAVRDAGPGPGPALVAAARRTSRGGGLRGHGLAIAAGVAARHGGALATGPDGGVVLELPRAVPDRTSARPRLRRPARATREAPMLPHRRTPAAAGPACRPGRT